jgi:glucose-1-phosphate cytidylyltransferase
VKVAILAGGTGSRLSEETGSRPKPLIEIGGKPILLHILRHFEFFGFSEFVIALGYKGQMIKEYFSNGHQCSHDKPYFEEKFGLLGRVTLIDTGAGTLTGGRIRRLRAHLNDETFMLTWGDGVSDINLQDLLAFHRSHGRLATLSAVRPPPRFGHLQLDGDIVTDFSEKSAAREGWINGAFFVLEPGIFDYIEGDRTRWEKEPLEQLSRDGQLMAYRHHSFWQCMDTIHDKRTLEELWSSGRAPWEM